MGSLTARPLAVAGIATLVTAVTITGSRVRPVEISPPRLLAESVQLQTFSTPKAAATAAAIADPGQILTNAVEAAVALAAATAWFIAFPITLPVSLVLGQAFTTVPFAGILQSGPILFFGIPALLVSSTVNQLALSLGLNSPFSAASPQRRQRPSIRPGRFPPARRKTPPRQPQPKSPNDQLAAVRLPAVTRTSFSIM